MGDKVPLGGEQTANFDIQKGRMPISVSIETDCGLVLKIAETGDILPAKASKIFSTCNDMPDVVAVRLYAGERPFAEDDLCIGEAKLTGIKRLSNGRPIISLVITIDKDFNIDIDATDEGSLKTVKTRIDGDWVPSRGKISAMVQDAIDNQARDNIRQNRARILQTAKESVCRCELKYGAIKKKLSADKARSYKQKISKLKAKLKKLKIEEMSRMDEKSITGSINELSVSIEAE